MRIVSSVLLPLSLSSLSISFSLKCLSICCSLIFTCARAPPPTNAHVGLGFFQLFLLHALPGPFSSNAAARSGTLVIAPALLLVFMLFWFVPSYPAVF